MNRKSVVFHSNLSHIKDIYSIKLDMEISVVMVNMNSIKVSVQHYNFKKPNASKHVPVQIH